MTPMWLQRSTPSFDSGSRNPASKAWMLMGKKGAKSSVILVSTSGSPSTVPHGKGIRWKRSYMSRSFRMDDCPFGALFPSSADGLPRTRSRQTKGLLGSLSAIHRNIKVSAKHAKHPCDRNTRQSAINGVRVPETRGKSAMNGVRVPETRGKTAVNGVRDPGPQCYNPERGPSPRNSSTHRFRADKSQNSKHPRRPNPSKRNNNKGATQPEVLTHL